jgi:predicted Zn-dependent protease
VLEYAEVEVVPSIDVRIQFRDVEIVEDDHHDEEILEIKVRGKRGVGYCKSTSGAVVPFKRLKLRPRPPRASDNSADAEGEEGNGNAAAASWPLPTPTELVFPKTHSDLFKQILVEEDLRFDR